MDASKSTENHGQDTSSLGSAQVGINQDKEQEIRKMNEQIGNVTDSHERIRRQIDDNDKNIEKLRELERENARLKDQTQAMYHKIKDLETTGRQKDAEIRQLKKQVKQLEIENTNLQKDLKKKEEQLKKQTNDIEQLKNQMEVNNRIMQTMQSDITELNNKFNQLNGNKNKPNLYVPVRGNLKYPINKDPKKPTKTISSKRY